MYFKKRNKEALNYFYYLYINLSGSSRSRIWISKYQISSYSFHGNYIFFEFGKCSQYKQLPHYFKFLYNKINFCSGNYSRAETILGNMVCILFYQALIFLNCLIIWKINCLCLSNPKLFIITKLVLPE